MLEDTQTLEQTKPNPQKAVLVLRFAGCSNPLILDDPKSLLDGDVLETINLGLWHCGLGEGRPNGEEEELFTLSVMNMDSQEFANLQEWYC